MEGMIRGTVMYVRPLYGACILFKADQFAIFQPNKFASRVFTPLVSSLIASCGGFVECMKLLIEVLQYFIFC